MRETAVGKGFLSLLIPLRAGGGGGGSLPYVGSVMSLSLRRLTRSGHRPW